MVGRGHGVLGPEEVAELLPEGAGELAAAVRDDALRDAVVLDPAGDEGVGTLRCGDALEWDGNQPAGEPVNDSEQVGMALGRRQRTDDVDVQGVELASRRGEGLVGRLAVLLDLGGLAVRAGADRTHSAMSLAMDGQV